MYHINIFYNRKFYYLNKQQQITAMITKPGRGPEQVLLGLPAWVPELPPQGICSGYLNSLLKESVLGLEDSAFISTTLPNYFLTGPQTIADFPTKYRTLNWTVASISASF